MLGSAAFLTKCADSRNVRFEALFFRRIRPWGKLNERVQRDFHPRGLFLRNIHVVRVDASQHGLVRYDQNVLATLELHDDGLQSDNDVAVTLAATVPVVVLVVVARLEVVRVPIGDLLIRQAVAYPGVKLIQSLPFELVKSMGRRGQKARGLNGAL